MTEQNDYETSLRECWRRECGATADERPNPSPSFRNIFKSGYKAGQHDMLGDVEQPHHFPDSTKMMRFEAAKSAMRGILADEGSQDIAMQGIENRQYPTGIANTQSPAPMLFLPNSISRKQLINSQYDNRHIKTRPI